MFYLRPILNNIYLELLADNL